MGNTCCQSRIATLGEIKLGETRGSCMEANGSS
jgi:hypothetical protein